MDDLHRLLDERDRMLEERLRQMMTDRLPSHVRGINGITQVGRTIVVDTRPRWLRTETDNQ